VLHEPPVHEPPAPQPVDPRIDRACLEQQLTPFVEAIGAGWPASFRPTGIVHVAAAGQTLYSLGVGASDLEQELPNTPSTSFRVGSITKQFTAAAILKLAEQGRLAVTDTIGDHLPEYPAVGAGITLHQLLSHTAGLFNYTQNAALMERRDQPLSPDELLASFWNEPLDFEPGTQFGYSNSNYVVLGAIIERVTGQTYAEYMQEAIFEPAGLKRTTVGDAEGLVDRASGYASDRFGELEPAFPIDMSVPYAAGSVRSTALDLVRWHRVLGTDLVLNASSRALLTTPVLAEYAYGWGVATQDGLEVVRHNGGIDGFLSDFVRVPELDLAIVVLLNATSVDPEAISNAALRCALGQDIPPEPPPALVELEPGQPEKLFGPYLITEQTQQLLESLGLTEEEIATLLSVSVFEESGTLFLGLIAGEPDLMLPTSQSDFELPFLEGTLHFTFAGGDALPATSLTIELDGLALVYER
jgi:CubicO group peptidase (beta-lactamase class C family)